MSLGDSRVVCHWRAVRNEEAGRAGRAGRAGARHCRVRASVNATGTRHGAADTGRRIDPSSQSLRRTVGTDIGGTWTKERWVTLYSVSARYSILCTPFPPVLRQAPSCISHWHRQPWNATRSDPLSCRQMVRALAPEPEIAPLFVCMPLTPKVHAKVRWEILCPFYYKRSEEAA